MNYTEFYNQLKQSLPESTTDERKMWASIIVKRELEINDLSRLL